MDWSRATIADDLSSSDTEFDFESLADYREDPIERSVDLAMARSAIETILESIPTKYSAVLRVKFGLCRSGLALSTDEAARALHISRQSITCRQCMGLAKLIHPQYSGTLRPFFDALCE